MGWNHQPVPLRSNKKPHASYMSSRPPPGCACPRCGFLPWRSKPKSSYMRIEMIVSWSKKNPKKTMGWQVGDGWFMGKKCIGTIYPSIWVLFGKLFWGQKGLYKQPGRSTAGFHEKSYEKYGPGLAGKHRQKSIWTKTIFFFRFSSSGCRCWSNFRCCNCACSVIHSKVPKGTWFVDVCSIPMAHRIHRNWYV